MGADDNTPAAIEDEQAKQLDPKASAASSVKSFFSGGFGGVSAVLVGHPFDLTKTRLQTAKEGTYTGGMDVVKKTIKADGIKGMYRGMGPPLVGVTPIFAISFWSYDAGKKLIYAATPNRKTEQLSLAELGFAGFFSAIPTTLVAGPAERVKVLLQVRAIRFCPLISSSSIPLSPANTSHTCSSLQQLQGQSSNAGPTYNGPVDVVRQLYKEGGLKSVFRGTGATLARDGPGSAA